MMVSFICNPETWSLKLGKTVGMLNPFSDSISNTCSVWLKCKGEEAVQLCEGFG